MFFRIPLLIELARLCLEHSKHDLAADCLENVKGGVKVAMKGFPGIIVADALNAKINMGPLKIKPGFYMISA